MEEKNNNKTIDKIKDLQQKTLDNAKKTNQKDLNHSLEIKNKIVSIDKKIDNEIKLFSDIKDALINNIKDTKDIKETIKEQHGEKLKITSKEKDEEKIKEEKRNSLIKALSENDKKRNLIRQQRDNLFDKIGGQLSVDLKKSFGFIDNISDKFRGMLSSKGKRIEDKTSSKSSTNKPLNEYTFIQKLLEEHREKTAVLSRIQNFKLVRLLSENYKTLFSKIGNIGKSEFFKKLQTTLLMISKGVMGLGGNLFKSLASLFVLGGGKLKILLSGIFAPLTFVIKKLGIILKPIGAMISKLTGMNGKSLAKGTGLLSVGLSAFDGYEKWNEIDNSDMSPEEKSKAKKGIALESGGSALGGVAGGFIGSILGPLGTLLGTALGSYIGSYMGKFLSKFDFGNLDVLVENVFSGLSGLFTNIDKWVDNTYDILVGYIERIPEILHNAINSFAKFLINDFIPLTAKFLKEAFIFTFTKIVPTLANIVTNISKLLFKLASSIIKGIGKSLLDLTIYIKDKFIELSKTFVSWVWNGIKTIGSDIWNYIKQQGNILKQNINSLFNNFVGIFSDMFTNIGNWFSSVFSMQTLNNLGESIVNSFNSVIDNLKEIPKKIWDSITSSVSSVSEKIGKFFKDLVWMVLDSVLDILPGWVRSSISDDIFGDDFVKYREGKNQEIEAQRKEQALKDFENAKQSLGIALENMADIRNRSVDATSKIINVINNVDNSQTKVSKGKSTTIIPQNYDTSTINYNSI